MDVIGLVFTAILIAVSNLTMYYIISAQFEQKLLQKVDIEPLKLYPDNKWLFMYDNIPMGLFSTKSSARHYAYETFGCECRKDFKFEEMRVRD